MKKIISLILSLMLLLSFCATPVFAGSVYNSDVSVSAALDKKELTASNSAQTVVLTIKTSKQVDLFSVGYKVDVPEGWSITNIESGSSEIDYSLEDGHFSLSTGIVSWYKAVNKSTDANGTIGKITISVPANAEAKSYTITVPDVELATSDQNNDNAWMSNGTATAQITIKALTGISVKTAPIQKSYVAGQNFNSAGMVITAAYNNGTTADVTGWTITDGNNLTSGKTSVTISYTEGGVTKTCTQAITVEAYSAKALTGISVKTAPGKTSYVAGQNFNSAGMVITAAYNNGTTADVTGWTVIDGNGLTAGKTYVTISYTESGVTKFCTQAITVAAKALVGISVKTVPSQTSYVGGQNFDPAGMVITATYNDGTTADVTGWTVADGNNLTAGKTTVTISYTEGGETKTCTQEITVAAKSLTEISVKTAPGKISYVAGQNFDLAGMVITAAYNNGTTADVTGWTVIDGNGLTAGKTFVTVSYTEGGVTKICTQTITVAAKALTGISVKTAPGKASYVVGENFDPAGMVITAAYNDGTTADVTGWTVIDGNNLTAGKTTITISYTEGSVTKICTQAITVAAKSITSEQGISATCEGGMEPGTELVAVVVTDAAAMATDVGENRTIKIIYNITLQNSGVKVQPNGKLIITLPLPQELLGCENLIVVYLAEDGTTVDMPTTRVGDTLVFETDHLSLYAVVEEAEVTEPTDPDPTEPDEPDEPDEPVEPDEPAGKSRVWLIIVVVVVVLVAAGACVYVFVFRKKKTN